MKTILDMLPMSIAIDAHDDCLTNAKHRSDLSLTHAIPKKRPDLRHIFVAKLRQRPVLAFLRIHSSAFNFVTNVVLVGAIQKVTRIATGGVVAGVSANIGPISMCQKESDSWRSFVVSAALEDTVSFWVGIPHPRPARLIVSNEYLAPKPVVAAIITGLHRLTSLIGPLWGRPRSVDALPGTLPSYAMGGVTSRR